MATNATELQKYFADMDAAEEADARASDLTVDELRTFRGARSNPENMQSQEDTRTAERFGVKRQEVEPLGLRSAGEEMTPPSLQKPFEYARPNPRAAVGLERMGLRLNPPVDMPDTVPSLSMPSGVPAKTSDFASLQKTMSPGALTSPIPVASAPVKADVPEAMKGAIAATTPTQPAPPAGTSSTVKPPPVDAGSGGDEIGRLSMGQALVRALDGSGSVISGQNLRSGAADTLGDRMKQIEALRAKKAEKAEEQAKASRFGSRLSTLFPGLTPEQQKTLEQTIAEGGVEAGINVAKMFKGAQTDKEVQQRVNEAALASAVSRYPELAASFEALRPVAGEYPQKDFAAMLERAASTKAGVAAKAATTQFTVDKDGRFNQLTLGEIDKQKLQNDKIRQDIDLNAKQFALKEKEALAAPGKDDAEKAIKLNDLAEKEKGFGGYVTLANDLSELEAAAPGFVTRGEAPEWLTSAQQSLGQNWPTSADPRVVKFLAAYGKLSNAERHRLYGSAQTAGELKSFLQQLNDNPFSSGPETLATQMTSFAGNVGRRATNTLNRYSSVFGAPVVDRVLGGEFRPLYEEGAVFSTFKTPFVAAAAAGTRPAAPSVGAGKTALWDAAASKWVQAPDEQVEAAVASGKYAR